VPNCTGFAACFSQLLVLMRRKSKLRSVWRSVLQGSRSRFHSRNARKHPKQNTAAKKRASQQVVDFGYPSANSSSSASDHDALNRTLTADRVRVAALRRAEAVTFALMDGIRTAQEIECVYCYANPSRGGQARDAIVNERLLRARHHNGESAKGRCSGLALRAATQAHAERLRWPR
jgi:hypothetical protein